MQGGIYKKRIFSLARGGNGKAVGLFAQSFLLIFDEICCFAKTGLRWPLLMVKFIKKIFDYA